MGIYCEITILWFWNQSYIITVIYSYVFPDNACTVTVLSIIAKELYSGRIAQWRGWGVFIWAIMEIDFMVLSWRGEWNLPDALLFTSSKILILPKFVDGQRSVSMCNSIAWAIFNCDSSKMMIFFDPHHPCFTLLSYHLQTLRYVLCIKTKIFLGSQFWFRP